MSQNNQSALVTRARVKDYDTYDDYLTREMQETMMRFLRSQNLTTEEVRRLEPKLAFMFPHTIKNSLGKRRNPSWHITGTVRNDLPMPPVKSHDDRARELVAERHKENPDETEAQAKAYFKALVAAVYNPPKLAPVKLKKFAQYELSAPMKEKICSAWRALLSSKGKRSRATVDEWETLAKDAGIENLTTPFVVSISEQVRSYDRNKKRSKKKLKPRAN